MEHQWTRPVEPRAHAVTKVDNLQNSHSVVANRDFFDDFCGDVERSIREENRLTNREVVEGIEALIGRAAEVVNDVAVMFGQNAESDTASITQERPGARGSLDAHTNQRRLQAVNHEGSQNHPYRLAVDDGRGRGQRSRDVCERAAQLRRIGGIHAAGGQVFRAKIWFRSANGRAI